MQPESSRIWDPGVRQNKRTRSNNRLHYLMSAVISQVTDESKVEDESEKTASRTELDSHANMAVVGRNATILSRSGNKVDVSPFTPDYKPMVVDVVDAAVQYMSPYTNETIIFVLRNALEVPSMAHNLIPPFMIREAGVQVSSVPKIHVKDPSVDDHALYFKETDLRVPLSLHGVFSYFPTCKPSEETLMRDDNIVYMLTPEHWDPNTTVYASNEASMLDWEGNLVEPKF